MLNSLTQTGSDLNSIVSQKTLNLLPVVLHKFDFQGFATAYIKTICQRNHQIAPFFVAVLDDDNQNSGGYELFDELDIGQKQREFANWTCKHFSVGHCIAFILCQTDKSDNLPGGVYEYQFFDGEIRSMRLDADRIYFTFQLNNNQVDRSLAVGHLDAIWCNPPPIPLHAQKKMARFVRPFLS